MLNFFYYGKINIWTYKLAWIKSSHQQNRKKWHENNNKKIIFVQSATNSRGTSGMSIESWDSSSSEFGWQEILTLRAFSSRSVKFILSWTRATRPTHFRYIRLWSLSLKVRGMALGMVTKSSYSSRDEISEFADKLPLPLLIQILTNVETTASTWWLTICSLRRRVVANRDFFPSNKKYSAFWMYLLSNGLTYFPAFSSFAYINLLLSRRGCTALWRSSRNFARFDKRGNSISSKMCSKFLEKTSQIWDHVMEIWCWSYQNEVLGEFMK